MPVPPVPVLRSARPPRQKLTLTIPVAQPEGPHSNVSVLSNLATEEESELFSQKVVAALAPGDGAPAAGGAAPAGAGGARLMEGMSQADWQAAARQGHIVELQRIGEGSGGSVKLCELRDRVAELRGARGPEAVFALKEITANPNTELQKQVLRELQVNKTCDSPYIVKYYGAYPLDEVGSIFIAMEYCQGRSLDAVAKQIHRRGGRLGEKVLARIAHGVLSGILYLYERNIMHRDIKPQNILLDGAGQVKLCDFGVSGQVVNSLATTFAGTSYYMAPERIQGQPYSVRSDVWSLGLTLLELAHGRFPFAYETDAGVALMPIELLNQIVSAPPPELQDEPELGIKWSAPFRHFLRQCLEPDAAKRAAPKQLLSHPWIVGNMKRTVRMDALVKEAWS